MDCDFARLGASTKLLNPEGLAELGWLKMFRPGHPKSLILNTQSSPLTAFGNQPVNENVSYGAGDTVNRDAEALRCPSQTPNVTITELKPLAAMACRSGPPTDCIFVLNNAMR